LTNVFCEGVDLDAGIELPELRSCCFGALRRSVHSLYFLGLTYVSAYVVLVDEKLSA
jgi:hypothetical protein